MPLAGPDVSNHQGAVDQGALSAAAQFLIAKATEGTGYADPWFAANRNGARASGLMFGAYHFASGGDPNAEASWFLAHADHQPGELLILDWEIAHPTPDAWCAAFCSRLAAAGVVPVVYMNSSSARGLFWGATRATGTVLWVAQYGINDGQPHAAPVVAPWSGYAMWQYTSAGTLPGIGGRCDVSTFYGDAPAWRALGGVGTVANPLLLTGGLPADLSSLTALQPTPVQEDDMRIISAPLPWDTSKRQQVWVTPSGGAGTLDDPTAGVLRQTWPSHDLDSWDALQTEVRAAWERHAAANGSDLSQADVQAAVEAGVRKVLGSLG